MNEDDIIEQQFRCEIKQHLTNIPKTRLEEAQERVIDFLEKNQTIDYHSIFSIKCDYREMTLIWSALFLLEFEGKFGFCVNLTYFLFVANDPKRQCFTFEEIESKPEFNISSKCEFLKKRGFNTLSINKSPLFELRNLRNTIGHFNFIIGEEGEFRTFNKDVAKRELARIPLEHGKLLNYTNAMIPALRDFTKV